ncbi:MAG: DNA-formamidopyrimidine glycosylase [Candidatus Vogelbacteria bacterium]|nr:DNA-formamidopyrimidine glycosylase [Candidatus Vogelbacteria bacterium]
MPELPEVETLRRELERALVGRVIKSVKIFWSKTVQPFTPTIFAKQLKNVRVTSIERTAKILFLNLSNGKTLAIHLKMTGQLVFQSQGSTLGDFKVEPLIAGGHPEDPKKYTRAVFEFNGRAKLYFNDLRKFGWLRLVSAKDKQIMTEKYGLEPLSPEFTLANFTRALTRYPNRKLKLTLLDQTLIAGLGNIYADESCFAAGLRPRRRVKTLTDKEIKKLHRAIKQILKLALAKGGTSSRNYVRSDGSPGDFFSYLKAYGRSGQPCRRCLTPIAKIKLAGRGAHFCKNCQR